MLSRGHKHSFHTARLGNCVTSEHYIFQTANQWTKNFWVYLEQKCGVPTAVMNSSHLHALCAWDKNEGNKDWSLQSLHAWDINWLIGMRDGTFFISSRFLFFLCCCDTNEAGFLKGFPEKYNY